jgi:hypothetical protein
MSLFTPGESTMSRAASVVVFSLALPLLLSAGQAQAQCGGGRQQNRSQQFGMGRNSSLQAAMQQNALQAAMQQYALQAAMQQYALQAASQQHALQTAFQQNAMLLASRQQTQPKQQNTSVQLPVVSQAGSGDSVTKPENAEELAARQLKIARDLLADADTTQQQGEPKRANKMRERAGERLLKLVENFSATQAAGEAQALLQTMIRQARY